MKIHLLVKKEDIQEEKLVDGRKIAVVFDVLLATTTITSALSDGAEEVITAETMEDALIKAGGCKKDFVLAGELNAKPIDGFTYPSPKILRESVKGKILILSTTNGTVALKKASPASKVYIACLLNNPYVAEAIQKDYLGDSTILVICSGNSGELSLEDFFGAGHFIDCLIGSGTDEIELTDSAKAALFFYRGNIGSSFDILRASLVGQLLEKHDMLDELKFAAAIGTSKVVPVLMDGKVIKQESFKNLR